LERLTSLVELVKERRERNSLANRGCMRFSEHDSQRFYRTQSTGHTAIGNEANWLASPLFLERINGNFQRATVAVVVFLGNHDNSISSINLARKAVHTLVAGHVNREIVIGKVDHIDLVAIVLVGFCGEPVGDGR